MKTYYNKLVRDNIPELIKKDGKKCEFKDGINYLEFIQRLKSKLYEETQELINANTKEEVAEELADIYEVALFLMHTHGITEAELKKVISDKFMEKGGFYNRIVLLSVENEEEE